MSSTGHKDHVHLTCGNPTATFNVKDVRLISAFERSNGMGLFNPIRKDIISIYKLVTHLDQSRYVQPHPAMLGASIGHHVRAILEFYSCILLTSNENVVCYGECNRNIEMEAEPAAAIAVIHRLLQKLNAIVIDRKVLVQENYTQSSGGEVYLSSSLFRELAHALDYSVHRQTILKMGLNVLNQPVDRSTGFSVALDILHSNTNVPKPY